jgi:hypothetical protein
VLGVMTSALAAAVVATATPQSGVSAAAPSQPGAVRILSQSARWTSLLAGDELKSEADTMFVISGELANRGATAVRWVKIRYQLLADTPDGEIVVASEYGYNFRAEALRGLPEESVDTLRSRSVRPIRPGGRDRFRMVFFRSDVVHFDRWRVSILEVR